MSIELLNLLKYSYICDFWRYKCFLKLLSQSIGWNLCWVEFLKNFLLNISFILLTTVNLMKKGSCLIVAEAHLEPDRTIRATKGVRKSKVLNGIGKG